MCIIIDANTLPSVFDSNAANHIEFKHVLDWINNGKGKLVYGGTKYKQELNRNYLKLFSIYSRARKAVLCNDGEVDAETKKVAAVIQHPDFDDPHLVALLRVSGCKLICSLDERAYTYFHHKSFFTPASTRPKIYKSSRNADLLCDENIAEVCRPCLKATNEEKNILSRN